MPGRDVVGCEMQNAVHGYMKGAEFGDLQRTYRIWRHNGQGVVDRISACAVALWPAFLTV